MCVYLSSTEADVEKVVVFGSFGGKTGSVHQCSNRAQGTVVKTQRHVVLRVGEYTVTVAPAVLLKKQTFSCALGESTMDTILFTNLDTQTHAWCDTDINKTHTLLLLLDGPQGLQASGPRVLCEVRCVLGGHSVHWLVCM